MIECSFLWIMSFQQVFFVADDQFAVLEAHVLNDIDREFCIILLRGPSIVLCFLLTLSRDWRVVRAEYWGQFQIQCSPYNQRNIFPSCKYASY